MVRDDESVVSNISTPSRTPTPTSTLPSGSATSLCSTSASETVQPKITSHFFSRKEDDRRAEHITQKITTMIANDMLPLSFAENEGFRALMKYLAPNYVIPSRPTITRRLHLKYENVKRNVMNILSKSQYVAFTTDTWSSRSSKSYCTVTAHCVTTDWQHAALNLVTQEMPERHTAENLISKIESVITDWNLTGKICAVVHDNASNITNAITRNRDIVGDSIPCFAHTLQLCVNRGLNSSTVIETIIKIGSAIVAHFHHSNVATEALKRRQQQLNLVQHKLIQRNNTRWNSTFYMFRRLVEQRQAINAVLTDRTVILSKTAANLSLNEESWATMEKFVTILEPFEKATTLLSAEEYVTLSMAKPLMASLVTNFLVISEDDLLCEPVNLFKTTVTEEINRRFRLIMSIEDANLTTFDKSSIMDPRFKSTLPENTKNYAIRYLELILEKNNNPCEEEQNAKSPSAMDFLFPKPSGTNELNEVERYIQEQDLDKNKCPLKWWEANEKKYPKLSNLARKFLCIPATSTPSERVFSTAGNIVRAKRSCLSSENIDILVFLYENRNIASD